jgi:hypothetical protein
VEGITAFFAVFAYSVRTCRISRSKLFPPDAILLRRENSLRIAKHACTWNPGQVGIYSKWEFTPSANLKDARIYPYRPNGYNHPYYSPDNGQK